MATLIPYHCYNTQNSRSRIRFSNTVSTWIRGRYVPIEFQNSNKKNGKLGNKTKKINEMTINSKVRYWGLLERDSSTK